jgi:hypothetical protein
MGIINKVRGIAYNRTVNASQFLYRKSKMSVIVKALCKIWVKFVENNSEVTY